MMHRTKLDPYLDVQSSISEYIGKWKIKLRAVAPTCKWMTPQVSCLFLNDIYESEWNPAML